MDLQQDGEELKRGLKNRHIQLIALGGAIGTGLFLGIADTIRMAGPAVLLGYAIGGFIAFLIMRQLGEMVVEDPGSIGFTLARREISGIAIADTTYEKTGLYWHGAAFALPHPPGLEMHDIRCVAVLPASDADKETLDVILGSLKFRAAPP